MNEEKLLQIIYKNGSFPVTKNTLDKEINILNSLKAYELIEKRNNHCWQLSQNGFLAIELGGYKKYLEKNNKSTNENNRFRNLENKKNKFFGFIEKLWWKILIPLLIGIILIYLKNKLTD